MKIGKYTLHVLETGSFALDGGAMFGIIPKPLWSKSNPADEMNRVSLNARNLLLVSDSRKILIDTGIGSGWDEKFAKIYRLDQSNNTAQSSLERIGINSDDITDVLLTHLHFDHTGGSTIFQDGKWIPAYPNAKYYIQKRHFEWAINPSERDKGSFIQDRFVPVHNEGLFHFIDGDVPFDDEIDFITINGHTFFQQMIKIHDSSNTILYCGDLFPFTSHIPIPYVMGYDLQPLITVQEKKKILPRAVEEKWKLFFEHDPKVIMATVAESPKGFTIDKVFTELP
ncbi:MAG: MBL fold metallo-hydrolase [Ignavibacteriae bacterium HGW-Ignavibacteriae-3]|nr:MAG: MBL fold metallo-hydrolase [Ignavibacteriae bacterium HGW-Ignavibacteriae-3]